MGGGSDDNGLKGFTELCASVLSADKRAAYHSHGYVSPSSFCKRHTHSFQFDKLF